MSITINCCPFCGHDDVEIEEVGIAEYAIDCPECRCIGPICGSITEAIERWNRSAAFVPVPVPDMAVPDWVKTL